MTRDELLFDLAVSRQVFDDKLALVPRDSLEDEVPGFGHSILQLAAHVSAHDKLVVDRLTSARHGATTDLEADHGDRNSYEASTWTFADGWPVDQVLREASAHFESLITRLRDMSDDELADAVGASRALDPAWLQGRPPWRAIVVDTVAHYREHEAMLDQAL